MTTLSGINTATYANTQAAGPQAQNAQNGPTAARAPKFGDGGLCSVPCAVASCCAAPIAIPAILIGGFFAIKALINKFRGA